MEDKKYIIILDECGDYLDYWSNELGWTRHYSEATKFSEDEIKIYSLPMLGKFIPDPY